MDFRSDGIRFGLPIALFFAISILAFIPPVRPLLRWVWRGLGWICARPGLALSGVAVVCTIGFAIPWMFGQVQPPNIHDEFSYLLAADTFRHFRLTNPTPPIWQAFQTMHVLVVPTYMSKFPPAQGLVLAAGWLLGSPRVGIIAAGVGAVLATAWMLRARMSWRWSILGGLVCATFSPTYEWTQHFWGGNVAMIGGALFCGAMLRIAQPRTSVRWSSSSTLKLGLLAGAGLAILANSRPFEGFLFAIILGVWLIVKFIRRRTWMTQLASVALGAAIVLVPVFIWMGYYNYRITGHALRMPYAVHAKQYMVAPVFWWEALQKPDTDIKHIAAFHEQFEFREYDAQTTVGGFVDNVVRKLRMIRWMAFWPIIYYPALIGGGFGLWRWRTARFALIVPLVLIVVHMLCTPWMRTHYLAPIVPLWIMFVVYAIRGLRLDRIPSVRWHATRELPLAVTIALVLGSLCFAMHTNILAAILRREAGHPRDMVLAGTDRVDGKHIIFVYYAPGPQDRYEWVYNEANLDNAKVIWVHMREPELDMELLNHFSDRSAWMLTIENEHFQLRPVLLKSEMRPAR